MCKVAYQLDFPDDLSKIHKTFHVSQHRKFVADKSTVVPLDDIQVDDLLNYVEKLVAIFEKKMKALCN